MEKSNDPASKKLTDLIYSYNLCQHVKTSTHNKGHMLDLVFTRSMEEQPFNLKVDTPVISDHSPISFNINLSKPLAERKVISFRKVNNIDEKIFQQDIMSSVLYSHPATDIDNLVKQYDNTLRSIFDKHAPLTTKEIRDRPNTPWYNEQVMEAKRLRRRAERKYLSSGLTVHKDILHNQHRNLCTVIAKAKQQFYHEAIVNNNSSKNLFKITDTLLHKKGDSILPTHDNPEQLANNFVDFFCDKIKTISQSFDATHAEHGPVRTVDNILTSFTPTTKDEVRRIIMEGNSKCCHLDPIPTSVLKTCLESLLPIIVKIINESLLSSIMPSELKSATVTPLIKKSDLDKDVYKNYRPVSNLTYLSKLIEKVVVKRLDEHMIRNDLYELCQSAYRRHHSTETVLVKIMDDSLCALDVGLCIRLVMLDQSAAFDTVSQEKLFLRFENWHGISGNALNWLRSYFSGRTQSGRIQGQDSNPTQLET